MVVMGGLRALIPVRAAPTISVEQMSRIKARRRSRLRTGLAALALILATPAGVFAADMPEFLRGSLVGESVTRWDGFNFGAQAGLTNMNANFGNSTSSLVAFILRNTELQDQFQPSTWTTLPSATADGSQYGAFVGYNFQWDQLVIGFDLAYNHTSSLQASASDTMSRQVVTTPDNVNHAVTIVAQSSIKLIDYTTMRMRAGYVFGQFLPYGFVGAAVGRFNYATTATVNDIGTPPAGSPIIPFNTLDTASDSKSNAIAAGFTTGLGMDVSLLPNVFMRGEWEFVAFTPVGGIRTNINTARVGVGARF
jgi:outer membrane immunogenic protein